MEPSRVAACKTMKPWPPSEYIAPREKSYCPPLESSTDRRRSRRHTVRRNNLTHKTLPRGRIVATLALGSQRLYDFLTRTPLWIFPASNG